MYPYLLRIALFLFGSGFCALVYQLAWLRLLRLVFGSSTAASAAVLAIFMGGLGAGALLFGPRAERATEPLRPPSAPSPQPCPRPQQAPSLAGLRQ